MKKNLGKIKHLDLFTGIAGFAYAVDQVWPGAEHIFCDNDPFCQQVIKKHYPNSKIYEDIREITANARSQKSRRLSGGKRKEISEIGEVYLLTGGFPCQPFSQAGPRKGTEDDRYLWPEMLRVILLTKPRWIIAENVRGLLTQQGGVVFEQVCVDLESNGYEVQPFVIPAVALNAPHRRDRVWVVANLKCKRLLRMGQKESGKKERKVDKNGQKRSSLGSINAGCISNTTNTEKKRFSTTFSRVQSSKRKTESSIRNDSNAKCSRRTHRLSGQEEEKRSRECGNENQKSDWGQNWLEVAAKLCRVDDGLPAKLDGFELSKPRHRVERLKALGNAIVPQVAVEIMKAIKASSL